MIGLEGGSKSAGTGSVNRAEKVSLTIAAVVTDVLANGNLVIQGRQEVRTNREVRELTAQSVRSWNARFRSVFGEIDGVLHGRAAYGARPRLAMAVRISRSACTCRC